MNITIEKGVCPKCNGYKVIDCTKIGYNSNIPSWNTPKHYLNTCPLCKGKGLIVVRTVEEIEKTAKEPSPPKDRRFKEGAKPPIPNTGIDN